MASKGREKPEKKKSKIGCTRNRVHAGKQSSRPSPPRRNAAQECRVVQPLCRTELNEVKFSKENFTSFRIREKKNKYDRRRVEKVIAVVCLMFDSCGLVALQMAVDVVRAVDGRTIFEDGGSCLKDYHVDEIVSFRQVLPAEGL